MKKLSDTEFKKRIQGLAFTVETAYINRRTKMEATCNTCGHKWSAVAQSLYTGHGCTHCNHGVKVSPEQIAYHKNIALTYNTVKVFSKTASYAFCIRHGLYKDFTNHMTGGKYKWCDESVKEEALMYSNREDFRFGSGGAYKYAITNNILDSICNHMVKLGSDNNCIYIWQLVGERWNDLPLYKIGITSTRLKDRRIKRTAAKGGFVYDIIIMKAVTDAKTLETQLLELGTDPKLTGFGGCTEVRALTNEELNKTKELIWAH